jgi:hypothetical protein
MNQLRRLIIALTAICVLALAAFALVNRPAVPLASDDDIIIKGGSLEIECGKNHGKDCLGGSENKTKYKHKQDNKHITNIVIRDVGNANQIFFDRSFDQTKQPQIEITYKAQIGVISK